MAADRKQTPDILGSLLGGTKPVAPKKQDTIIPEYHNTGIPEYHKDSIPEGKPTIKPVSQSTSKPARQKRKPATPPAKAPAPPREKVKATFYLDTGAVEALEEGWIQLRKLAPKAARGSVSKSLIVELALQMALEDLDSHGKSSQIARKML